MTEERSVKTSQWAASFESGDFAAAADIARRLIAADGQDGGAFYLLALALFRGGKAQEALEPMRSALELDPMNAACHNDYGVMLAALGRWDEAAAAHGMAAALDPKSLDARYNLALALFRGGQKERARAELDRLLEKHPDSPDALALEGEVLRDEGKLDAAIEALDKAVLRWLETLDASCAPHPRLAEAYNLLGMSWMDKGGTARAAMCLALALAANPLHDRVYTNLGALALGEGWVEDAIFVLKRALAITPRLGKAWNNLGYALLDTRRFDEAEKALRRARELMDDTTEADANLGILLLARGELAEGWRYYASRWRLHWVARSRPAFSVPEWDGGALGGQTLLVYREQGLGDCLQFARYLPLLRERHPDARVLFWSHAPLDRLFTAQAADWGVDILPGKTDAWPPFDRHIPLMSLPMWMGTTLANIPARVPYIVPRAEWVGRWSARLDPLPGRKVGLVWSGGEVYARQKFRSVRLKELAPMLDVGGISWVSLQKGEAAGQIAEQGLADRIFDPMDEVGDFADTAAIVAGLDLVVSVDTSVAHLAGAMGKPVWLLNRFDSDWRWLDGREDSPWYPTMRIFRQSSFGDWKPVIQSAAGALAAWVTAGGGDPARTLTLPEARGAKQPLAGQVFGDAHLSYQIVRARHGWMLANPNDVYIGRALLEYGEYSEIEARMLHRLLFKPGRVVEVGANMGSHSVGLARAAAARGEEMVVFEPQPVVFQNLCANLALNGLRNVRAWPFACGDETGTVTFAEPDDGAPGNFGGVGMGTEEGAGRVTVPCVRLDDFLGEGEVALIKVDVEGFELAVLRGAEETLRRFRPVLYVENDRPDPSKELIEWLWSREYRLFWHTPRFFNPRNFFGQSANRYGNSASFNMIGMPKELIEGKQPGFDEIVDSSKSRGLSPA